VDGQHAPLHGGESRGEARRDARGGMEWDLRKIRQYVATAPVACG
jgi:hypothetical protein